MKSINEMFGLAEHELGRPQDLQCEEYILGAILSEENRLDDAMDIVDADDFLEPWHYWIFKSMLKLAERNEQIDCESVGRHTARELNRSAEECIQYCHRLAFNCVAPSHTAFWSTTVAQEALRRRVMKAAVDLYKIAGNYDDYKESEHIATHAENIMQEALSTDRGRASSANTQTLAASLMEQIERGVEAGGKPRGMSTGLSDLDHQIGGLNRGELYIVAASTSVGKTALAFRVVESFGISRRRVMIFSLEMAKERLQERMFASFSRIDLADISAQVFMPGDLERLSTASKEIARWDVEIDDRAAASASYIRSRLRRHAMRRPVDLVIVDHIHIMQGDGQYEREDLKLGAVATALHDIAKDMRVPVIALAQLNRNPGKRTGGAPLLDDIESSGKIAHMADVVIAIHRPMLVAAKEPGFKMPEPEEAQLHILKNRNGPRGGVVPVSYTGRCVRFDGWGVDGKTYDATASTSTRTTQSTFCTASTAQPELGEEDPFMPQPGDEDYIEYPTGPVDPMKGWNP